MYRINFDHKTGKFILQTSIFFGLCWVTVKDGDADSENFDGYAFNTYMDAKLHVSQIGLDQLYKDKSANQFHDYIMGR